MGIVVSSCSLLFFSLLRSAFERYHITALHNSFLHGSISHACIASHTWAFVWDGLCRRVGFSFLWETRLRRLFFGFGSGLCVFVFLCCCCCCCCVGCCLFGYGWVSLPWLLIPRSLAARCRAGGQVFRIWMGWDGMGGLGWLDLPGLAAAGGGFLYKKLLF